jgi:hypothetical protein
MLSYTDTRLVHLKRFYFLLDSLKVACGRASLLKNCSGRLQWPQRGIYFFYENGENRTDSGAGQRVVRIGTHALTNSSRTTLWHRLSQHRGIEKTGGGNHRGSIFRLLVGQALIQKQGFDYPHWGKGGNAPEIIRLSEYPHEKEVSRIIRDMPFLWLAINDNPSPASVRGHIERNAIALLSNFGKDAVDPASQDWLGNYSNRDKVKKSGLWNQNHIEDTYDPAFLDVFERVVAEATSAT